MDFGVVCARKEPTSTRHNESVSHPPPQLVDVGMMPTAAATIPFGIQDGWVAMAMPVLGPGNNMMQPPASHMIPPPAGAPFMRCPALDTTGDGCSMFRGSGGNAMDNGVVLPFVIGRGIVADSDGALILS
eukprot:TRINITY_DN2711_c0_g1_i1.p1 TRINITY_DN2711_c0_g1~~TRINITY_DN2711_c0_g1_i1.p1  ORF type:complete len:130 (-),score=7.15 TRINITY_DN2711_c0_g1_i1:310-699(-)